MKPDQPLHLVTPTARAVRDERSREVIPEVVDPIEAARWLAWGTFDVPGDGPQQPEEIEAEDRRERSSKSWGLVSNAQDEILELVEACKLRCVEVRYDRSGGRSLHLVPYEIQSSCVPVWGGDTSDRPDFLMRLRGGLSLLPVGRDAAAKYAAVHGAYLVWEEVKKLRSAAHNRDSAALKRRGRPQLIPWEDACIAATMRFAQSPTPPSQADVERWMAEYLGSLPNEISIEQEQARPYARRLLAELTRIASSEE